MDTRAICGWPWDCCRCALFIHAPSSNSFWNPAGLLSTTSEEMLGCSVFLQLLFFFLSCILQPAPQHRKVGLGERIIFPSVLVPMHICPANYTLALYFCLGAQEIYCQCWTTSSGFASFSVVCQCSLQTWFKENHSCGERLGYIQSSTFSTWSINKVIGCEQNRIIATLSFKIQLSSAQSYKKY